MADSPESSKETGVWIAPYGSVSTISGKVITHTGFRAGITLNGNISIFANLNSLISRNITAGFQDEIIKKNPVFNSQEFGLGFEYLFNNDKTDFFSFELTAGALNTYYDLMPVLQQDNTTYNPKFGGKWFISITPAVKYNMQITSWFKMAYGLGYDLVLGDDFIENSEITSAEDLRKIKFNLELHFGSF